MKCNSVVVLKKKKKTKLFFKIYQLLSIGNSMLSINKSFLKKKKVLFYTPMCIEKLQRTVQLKCVKLIKSF